MLNDFLKWLATFIDNRHPLPRSYYLRYLPPKEAGLGQIVACIGTRNLALKDLREQRPHLFQREGFYTLAVGTGETLTVKE